jgi:hypothetical protein
MMPSTVIDSIMFALFDPGRHRYCKFDATREIDLADFGYPRLTTVF